MKELKVSKTTVLDWAKLALTTENEDYKKQAYAQLSLFGIKSESDCLAYLQKSKVLLQNRKNIFDNTTSPNVEMLFERYCQAKNQTFTDAYARQVAIKDALIGNTQQESMDYGKLHAYLMSSAEKWRKRVLSGLDKRMPTLTRDADYNKIQDFYNYLQSSDFNIPFDPSKPLKGILSLDYLEEKFGEVSKLQMFENLRLPCTLQNGNNEYIHVYSTNKNTEGVNIRLYLNIKSNHRVQLMMMLKDECEKVGINFYGKFCGNNSTRNDNFLVYTNYAEVNKICEILNRARTQVPEFFEGAENLAPIWGRISNNEFIGVGDEPMALLSGKGSSYSSIREKIFEDYIKEYGTTFDYEKMKDICRSYGVSIDNFSFTMDTFAKCSTEEKYLTEIQNIDKIYNSVIGIETSSNNTSEQQTIKLAIEKLLKEPEIISEINFNKTQGNQDGRSQDIDLSGKLIGEVFRFSIIHQSEGVDKAEVIKYLQDIKNIYLQSYHRPEQERTKFVESERSRIIAKSIADKLKIDHSSKMPSPQDIARIKEYFIRNYIENGYVFHSFPTARKESVQRDGFTRVEKLWDHQQLKEIVSIFEEQGVIKALGGYGFYTGDITKGKSYVEHNPDEIFFHALSSPEWFKIFTSSAHSLGDKSLASSPFFVKDYDACKQNVIDLCNNAGISHEDKQKVATLFKQAWETLGQPELTTALIPRKKVGKGNVPKQLEGLDVFETISYVLNDSAGEFHEHTGNVVDLSQVEGSDIEVIEMPPADTFLTCDTFKRETREELYDPSKNIQAIYYGIVSSNGTMNLTQEQYNKVFNKMEDVFADDPQKLGEINKNWDKFDRSISHSSLPTEKKEEVVGNFQNMEMHRQELNTQQQVQPTTPQD